MCLRITHAPAVMLLCAIAFGGCSSVCHTRVVDDEADKRANGIRYYQTSLYLFVWSDGLGGVKTEWKNLPDPSKKMVATPREFVSQVKTSMQFKNGVFTSATDSGDATAVPTAIINAATSLLPGVMALRSNVQTFDVPGPYVYKVELYEGKLHFTGDGPADSIKVPLRPESSS